MSILHVCQRCGKLLPKGIRQCPDCQPHAADAEAAGRKEEMRRYNSKRDPKLLKFYRSKEWKTTSRAKLDRDRMCEAKLEGCQLIACEVHHRKPLRTREGWNERLEWDNLMSVCTRCHNKLDNKWGKRADYNIADKGVVDFKAIEKELRADGSTP